MGLLDALGSIAGGLLGAVGSAGSSFMSYQSAKKLQDSQNAFTERMSNTAYQRATSDMRSANLNPALMYGNGSAASTPSAGNASMDVGNPISSAMEYYQGRANIQATQANAAFAHEQAKTEQSKRANYEADSALKQATAMATNEKLPYETRKLAAETKNLISASMLNDEIRKYTGYNAESNRMQANAANTSAGASVISAGAAKTSSERYTVNQVLGKTLNDVKERYGKPIKDWALDPKRSKYSRKIWNYLTR